MFEWLVLGMLFLFIAYKLGRKICGKEGIIAKRKEGKLHKDARKFEKLKQWFEKAEVAEPEKDKTELRLIDRLKFN